MVVRFLKSYIHRKKRHIKKNKEKKKKTIYFRSRCGFWCSCTWIIQSLPMNDPVHNNTPTYYCCCWPTSLLPAKQNIDGWFLGRAFICFDGRSWSTETKTPPSFQEKGGCTWKTRATSDRKSGLVRYITVVALIVYTASVLLWTCSTQMTFEWHQRKNWSKIVEKALVVVNVV